MSAEARVPLLHEQQNNEVSRSSATVTSVLTHETQNVSSAWNATPKSKALALAIEETFQVMQTRKLIRRLKGTYKSDKPWITFWAFLIILLVFGVVRACATVAPSLQDKNITVHVNLEDMGFFGLVAIVTTVFLVYTLTRVVVIVRWALYWLLFAEVLFYFLEHKVKNMFTDTGAPWLKWALLVVEILTFSVYGIVHIVYPWLLGSRFFRQSVGARLWYGVRPVVSQRRTKSLTFTYRSSLFRRRRNTCTYRGDLDDFGLPHGQGCWMDDDVHGEILSGVWEHGYPVGPFQSREYGSGYAFVNQRIGYLHFSDDTLRSRRWIPRNSEPPKIGVASVECSVTGQFFSHLPKVESLFGPFILASEGSKSSKYLPSSLGGSSDTIGGIPLLGSSSSRSGTQDDFDSQSQYADNISISNPHAQESHSADVPIEDMLRATVSSCLRRMPHLSTEHPSASLTISADSSRGITISGHTPISEEQRLAQIVIDVVNDGVNQTCRKVHNQLLDDLTTTATSCDDSQLENTSQRSPSPHTGFLGQSKHGTPLSRSVSGTSLLGTPLTGQFESSTQESMVLPDVEDSDLPVMDSYDLIPTESVEHVVDQSLPPLPRSRGIHLVQSDTGSSNGFRVANKYTFGDNSNPYLFGTVEFGVSPAASNMPRLFTTSFARQTSTESDGSHDRYQVPARELLNGLYHQEDSDVLVSRKISWRDEAVGTANNGLVAEPRRLQDDESSTQIKSVDDLSTQAKSLSTEQNSSAAVEQDSTTQTTLATTEKDPTNETSSTVVERGQEQQENSTPGVQPDDNVNRKSTRNTNRHLQFDVPAHNTNQRDRDRSQSDQEDVEYNQYWADQMGIPASIHARGEQRAHLHTGSQGHAMPHLKVRGWKSAMDGHAEALVFFPGFNSSTEQSLQRLGQFMAMGHFPPHIKPFLFRYPSGRELTYLWALEAAESDETIDALELLLKGIRDAGIRDIHFMAHSMGAMALLAAFEDRMIRTEDEPVDCFSSESNTRESKVSRLFKRQVSPHNFDLGSDAASRPWALCEGQVAEDHQVEGVEQQVTPDKLLVARTVTFLNPDYPLSWFLNGGFASIRRICNHVTVVGDRKDGALYFGEIGNGCFNGLYESNCIPSWFRQAHYEKGLRYSKIARERRNRAWQREDGTSLLPRGKGMKREAEATFHGVDPKSGRQLTLGRSVFACYHLAPSQLQGSVSSRVHFGYPGFTKYWLDVDCVDTTWMDQNVHAMRHNYFNLNPVLLEDLRELIVTGKRAAERSLLMHREGNIYSYCSAPACVVNE